MHTFALSRPKRCPGVGAYLHALFSRTHARTRAWYRRAATMRPWIALVCATHVAAYAVPSSVVLFNSGSCPYAQRAWIALEEKKVSYDWKKVDLFNKDVRTRALTPTRGHAHAGTHTRMMHTHARAHTRTHTHTHARTHACTLTSTV